MNGSMSLGPLTPWICMGALVWVKLRVNVDSIVFQRRLLQFKTLRNGSINFEPSLKNAQLLLQMRT